jgi:hypothetical protein
MARSYRAPLLLCVAFLAAALAACGSGSSKDAEETLNKAFSTPIKSARVDLEVTIKLDGIKQLKDPVKLSVQGPYESGGKQTIPKADWDIAASAAGQNFSAGFISTGQNAWVQFQGQSYEVGSAAVAQLNQQIAQAGKNSQKKGLSQFGIDPRDWLENAKSEGTDSVGGVETEHVSATLNVGKLLDDLNRVVKQAGGSVSSTRPSQLTDAQKKQIQDVVENPTFDVYAGKDDNVIRRLSADIAFKVPSDKQAQVGGLKSGTVSFSIDFADVGQPQSITPPANAKPLSELTAQLGGLSGLLGGAGGGTAGSSSGSSSGSPSAAALQRYSACLQKADPTKPAELQKCAEFVK